MKKDKFEALLQSARDAAAYVRGDKSRAVTHVVEDVDAAAARAALGLTQEEFAAAFGVSMATLRNWEQGHRRPTGPARVLLQVIAKEPEAVLRAVRIGPRNAGTRKNKPAPAGKARRSVPGRRG